MASNEYAKIVSDRNTHLDTLRGMACVLLTFYHVVGLDPASGLRLPLDSHYRALNDILAYIRMPLFTILSGVVYAMRPVSVGAGRDFAQGKLKRLLIPFIFVSLIFAVAQKLAPETNSDLTWTQIPLVLIWPYAHMWFIAGLLLVFALVSALDYWHALDKPLHMFALFALACVLFKWRHGAVGVFSWNRALYLLPFFVAGIMSKRFGWKWGLSCALLATLSPGWELTLGVGFGVALLVLMPAISLLGRLGIYSYSIYLFHVFGTASSRIIWETIGISDVPFLLLSGTLAGVIVPIAIHLTLERVPYVSRAFLGVRHKATAVEVAPTLGLPKPIGIIQPRVE